MTIEYNVETTFLGSEIIWYEKDGFKYSFTADPANSDYQAYLNKDNPVEHFTPMVDTK
jgi:hypothetical protein